MDAIAKQKSATAAVVAIRCEDEIVLVRSRQKKNWGFPGGSSLPEEKPEVAALRLVREEVGLDIEKFPLKHLGEIDNTLEDHTLHLFGVALAPGSFDHLAKIGSRGHQIWRCKLEQLGGARLKRQHRLLIQQLR